MTESVTYANTVLDYFDSGAGPLPGPYGANAAGVHPIAVPVTVVTENPMPPEALSLPTGSYVTVGFSETIVRDGPGDDIAVVETGPSGERAEVYVSEDGMNFVLLGVADADDTTSSFDLASIGFDNTVQAVKVVGLDNGGTSPGFDVVNVQALHDVQNDLVEIKFRTFIPTEAVNVVVYPTTTVNGGDNRTFSAADGASFRTRESVILAFDSQGNPVLEDSRVEPNETGLTRLYDKDDASGGILDWQWSLDEDAVPIAMGKADPASIGGPAISADGDSFLVTFELSGKNPIEPPFDIPAEQLPPPFDWLGEASVERLEQLVNDFLPLLIPPFDAEISLDVSRDAAGNLSYAVVGEHDGFPAYELIIDDEIVYSYDPIVAGATPLDLLPPNEISFSVDGTVDALLLA